MRDRIPTPGQEGLAKITPVSGSTPYYAKIEMADNPTEPGTPNNTANLLSNATCSLIGLQANSATVTVNSALNAIRPKYGACTTEAATNAKVASADGFVLFPGATVALQFSFGSTATAPTLNVSGTGAKPLYYNGSYATAGRISVGMVAYFVYSGSRWMLINPADPTPSGVIAMWSGSSTAIPAGWAVCNGSNGTPNLANRFIVGAGGSYSIGSSGGTASYNLSTSQMPAHGHSVQSNTLSGTTTANTLVYTSNSNAYDVTYPTSTAGSGASIDNRPPYYALFYIMRL